MRSHRLVLCPLLLLALASCKNPRQTGPSSVVARAGSTVLTIDELRAELSVESSASRRRFGTTADAQKRYVTELIKSRLLLAEARRRGLDRRPEIQRRIRQIVVAELFNHVRSEVGPRDITDDHVRTYYEAHRQDYGRPRLVRASEIVVATRQEAMDLWNRLRSATPAAMARTQLSQLARQKSMDPRGRLTGGDLGFFDISGNTVPAVVATRAHGIADVGQCLKPFAVDGRWHVVMKTGERPEVVRGLDQVSAAIRARLLMERRNAAIDQLVKRLLDRDAVVIDASNLARAATP